MDTLNTLPPPIPENQAQLDRASQKVLGLFRGELIQDSPLQLQTDEERDVHWNEAIKEFPQFGEKINQFRTVLDRAFSAPIWKESNARRQTKDFLFGDV